MFIVHDRFSRKFSSLSLNIFSSLSRACRGARDLVDRSEDQLVERVENVCVLCDCG